MIIEEQLVEDVKKITLMDYETYRTQTDGKVLATQETIVAMIENLICEVEHWKEKYEDLTNQINNDYKPEIEVPEIHGKGISY